MRNTRSLKTVRAQAVNPTLQKAYSLLLENTLTNFNIIPANTPGADESGMTFGYSLPEQVVAGPRQKVQYQHTVRDKTDQVFGTCPLIEHFSAKDCLILLIQLVVAANQSWLLNDVTMMSFALLFVELWPYLSTTLT
jgi:hypothetical protein